MKALMGMIMEGEEVTGLVGEVAGWWGWNGERGCEGRGRVDGYVK